MHPMVLSLRIPNRELEPWDLSATVKVSEPTPGVKNNLSRRYRRAKLSNYSDGVKLGSL